MEYTQENLNSQLGIVCLGTKDISGRIVSPIAIKALLNEGANPKNVNAILYLCSGKLSIRNKEMENFFDAVKILISGGVEINSIDLIERWTALDFLILEKLRTQSEFINYEYKNDETNLKVKDALFYKITILDQIIEYMRSNGAKTYKEIQEDKFI